MKTADAGDAAPRDELAETLTAWWQRNFADLSNAGIDLETAADTMLAVGAARLAEAVSVRRASQVLYLLALRMAGEAGRIDAATAAATVGQGR